MAHEHLVPSSLRRTYVRVRVRMLMLASFSDSVIDCVGHSASDAVVYKLLAGRVQYISCRDNCECERN